MSAILILSSSLQRGVIAHFITVRNASPSPSIFQIDEANLLATAVAHSPGKVIMGPGAHFAVVPVHMARKPTIKRRACAHVSYRETITFARSIPIVIVGAVI